tara:strand:- start:334 stop:1059 length:726 start_codon:yes stop_codon:yes gene_type:complete
MIDAFNEKVTMSSRKADGKMYVTFLEHTIEFDLSNKFNHTFGHFVKRGNGFDKFQIIEPGFLKALNGISKNFKIDHAIDIGCQNLYTTLMMQKVFDANVVGYDIDPIALEAAHLNLASNPTDAITINSYGFGNGENNTVLLNDYTDPVDLILSDIEGYQSEVIEGGLEFINNKRPIIIMETDKENAVDYKRPDRENIEGFEDYAYLYNTDHRARHTIFQTIERKDIPVNDGLLICIPKERM